MKKKIDTERIQKTISKFVRKMHKSNKDIYEIWSWAEMFLLHHALTFFLNNFTGLKYPIKIPISNTSRNLIPKLVPFDSELFSRGISRNSSISFFSCSWISNHRYNSGGFVFNHHGEVDTIFSLGFPDAQFKVFWFCQFSVPSKMNL